ncbi:charged multivesicular body protein 4b-like [Styela clava]|uniref:charged multivesicular body protein 4b-like n=1 Tax=Styela clava TaxID=7725 RepID=UPI00193A5690|nr:charged multivesicular body protein 4b-like [Styela clava]
MSGFAKLFGGGKAKQPSKAEAIQRLKETQEMLEKKSEYLEKKMEEELKTARRHGTKNKRLALTALKRKKRYEKQLNQVDGTLSNIEFQVEALQEAEANAQTFKNMQLGAKALKQAHGNMSADDVHDVMDDIAEQQEVAQEISDALSGPVGFGTDVDEDELLAELEELEQEDLDKELLAVGTPSDLPEVPTSSLPAVPAKKEKNEDDELRELESWMAS